MFLKTKSGNGEYKVWFLLAGLLRVRARKKKFKKIPQQVSPPFHALAFLLSV